MTGAAAALNIAVGLAYVYIGSLTARELVRGWKTLGYSHFGVAFLSLAWTCGPHHLAHGLHLLEGRSGGGMDIITAAIGLPAGALWVSLRVEAERGGRGDRFIEGTPWWMHAFSPALAVYLTTIGIGIWHRISSGTVPLFILPNLLLVVIYALIGVFLLRTQLRNRAIEGGWSASGLLLSGVFLTCSVMHLAWASYAVSGRNHFDPHGAVIDWVSVPAGAYFLLVVRGLYRDALRDRNGASDEVLTTVNV